MDISTVGGRGKGPRKSRGRPLSPATAINANVKGSALPFSSSSPPPPLETGVVVTKKKQELVVRVKTIKDLREAVQKHLHGSRSVVFNYEGIESLDEIIDSLFVYMSDQQQQNRSSLLDSGERERLYAKLMKDLNKEGYDNQENIQQQIRNKPEFDSTEDLLLCLMDESTTPSGNDSPSGSVNSKQSVLTLVSSDVDINSTAVSTVHGKPKSPVSELLEQTGDIIEVDPKAFENIQLEETPDLDGVEGTDLLPNPLHVPSISQTTALVPLQEVNDVSDGDSYYSAETTLSASPSDFIPKPAENNMMSPSCDIDEPTCSESNAAQEEVKQNQIPMPKPRSLHPGLTDDELALVKSFSLKSCFVRLVRPDLKKPELEKVEVISTSTLPKRGRKKTTGNIPIRRTSPRKALPLSFTPLNDEQNCPKVVGTATPTTTTTPTLTTQPTTGKTRIKARQPTEEELRLAQAASISPQDIILRRLSSSSRDNETPVKSYFSMFRRTASSSSTKQDVPADHDLIHVAQGSIYNTLKAKSIPCTGAVNQTKIPDSPRPLDGAEIDTVESPEKPYSNHDADDAVPQSSIPLDVQVPEHQNSIPLDALVSVPGTGSGRAVSEYGSSRANISIEEELDDLLGPIPVFDLDEPEPIISQMPSCVLDSIDNVGEFVEVSSFLPDTSGSTEPELEYETQQSDSGRVDVRALDVDKWLVSQTEQLPVPIDLELSSSVNELPLTQPKPNVLKSARSKLSRSGPKSRTRPLESPSPKRHNERLHKRQELDFSSSSSNSSAYVPLLDEHSSKSKSSKKLTKQTVYTPTSAPATKSKPGTKPEKVVVDVNESDGDSSSSSSSKSEIVSDMNSNEEVEIDLRAILPPNSHENQLLLSMEEEFNKEKPKLKRLVELMHSTTSYRRRFLKADNYDIQHGLSMFPALKSYRIIKMEYNQINTGIMGGRMEMLETKLWDQLQNASSSKKRPGQKRHGLWERALDLTRDNHSLTEGMKRVLGMICFCFYLAEDETPKNLLVVRNRGQSLEWKSISTPRLVMFEDEVLKENADCMWIYAEGLKHVQVPNIYEGVLTVYALHYVFDVEYAVSLKSIFKQFDALAKIKT